MAGNTKKIALKDYWNALNNHDWFYSFSDDQRVWKKGLENETKLKAASMQSPDHKKLYEGFSRHHNIYSETTFPKPRKPSLKS